ncbi:MAG: hypothetical protein Kow0031_05300 [Anaerolineae bacterium]
MLRGLGYDAGTIFDQQMVGEPDHNIAADCLAEKRSIVRLDTDFADIRVYPPAKYSGIIVMRLRRHDKPYVLGIVQRWMKALSQEPLIGKLWIVDERQIRIRS